MFLYKNYNFFLAFSVLVLKVKYKKLELSSHLLKYMLFIIDFLPADIICTYNQKALAEDLLFNIFSFEKHPLLRQTGLLK